MPKIPDYRDQAQLRVNNPTGIASSADDRIIGESVAQFGQGLERFGAAYAEFMKEGQRKKNQLEAAAFGEESETAHFQMAELARSKSSPDGLDLVPNYLAVSQKWSEDRAAKLEGESKEVFLISAAKARNARLGDLYGVARGMQEQSSANRRSEINNKTVAMATADPDRGAHYFEEMRAGLDDDLRNGRVRAEDYAKADKDLQRMGGDAVVSGYTQRRNWDGARKAVLETFAGGYDAESRSKALERIDQAETNFATAKYRELKRQREEDKIQLRERQDANRSLVMERLRVAKTPQEKLSVYSFADSLNASGYLTKEDYNEIQARQNARQERTSTATYTKLRSSVEAGRMSTAALKRQVTAGWVNGSLTEADGDKLYALAHQREAEAKRGVTISNQVSRVEKMIDSLTRIEGPNSIALKAMGITDPSRYGEQMKDEFMGLRMKNPTASPYELGRKLIKEHFPAEQTKRLVPVVPGIPPEKQNDVEWLKTQGKAAILRRYKLRQTDEPTTKKALKLLDNRVELLPALEN